MNRGNFGPKSPGSLVEISTQIGSDIAFVPNPLPAPWEFNPSLWPLLMDARESLAALNGIGQTLPNPMLLLRPLQNREAITSSSIEGTFVTPSELLLFELHPDDSRTSHEKFADRQEVHNYSQTIHRGQQMLSEMPICNRFIRAMHEVLMQGVRGGEKTPGQFRKFQVQIGANAKFVPPPATEVENLMANLERYVNEPKDQLDPLIRCFLVHYQFETIHPFLDGNGRIGRALIAMMIYHWFGHSHPWLYMSAYFESHKDEYMNHLYRISTQGTWNEWIEFCLRGVIVQAKDAVSRCNRFGELRKEFHARVKNPTPRTHDLIERLFESPLVQVSTVASQFRVTYPTAKADLEILKQVKILEILPKSRPKAYFSPEIFRIAYDHQ